MSVVKRPNYREYEECCGTCVYGDIPSWELRGDYECTYEDGYRPYVERYGVCDEYKGHE